jgi:hypothetical protein
MKERFLAEANRICADAVRREDEHAASVLPPSRVARNLADYLTWISGLHEIIGDATRALRRLEPPRGDEAKIDAMLTKFEQVRAKYVGVEAAARAGDNKRWANLYDEAVDIAREGQYEAAVYGLDKCTHFTWG